MKFKFDFGKLKLALLICVIVLAVAAIIINILYVVGVGILKTTVPAVAGTSIACSALIMIFALLIAFNSYYEISGASTNEDGVDVSSSSEMKFCMGFITEKINLQNVTFIKRDAKKDELYLLYSESEVKQGSIKIMIKKKDNAAFIEAIRKANPQILLSDFNDVDKNEEDTDENK
ncbi:MAG: hypothetical protein SPD42_03535 [Eubacteriales bacterium]|nr:hypothetical protein [Eubacteriales bacterium]